MLHKNSEFVEDIFQIAKEVRMTFEKEYGSGTNLCGFCIEASEMIASLINEKMGIGAKTVEGWCRFDDEYYGSDHPWDPHTWVEVPMLNLYVDVTADQFNFGMYEENEFSPILICSGLPHGMSYEEPCFECDKVLENDKQASLDEILLVARNVATGRVISKNDKPRSKKEMFL